MFAPPMAWPSKNPDDYVGDGSRSESGPSFWTWASPWWARAPALVLGWVLGAAAGGMDDWTDVFPLGWGVAILSALAVEAWWRRRRRAELRREPAR
jgi:hypothetical protein